MGRHMTKVMNLTWDSTDDYNHYSKSLKRYWLLSAQILVLLSIFRCHIMLLCFFPWQCLCCLSLLSWSALTSVCISAVSVSFVSQQTLDPQGGVAKEKHIFRNEASLVEIQGDRSGLAGLLLPEAQLRCWLAQFLCNLFLQFIVRCVQRDRQSHSVYVVDLHYNRACLCSLRSTSILGTNNSNTAFI